MKYFVIGLLAVVIQCVGLSAFLVISTALSEGRLGGRIVIALTVFSMACLLWYGVRVTKTLRERILLPILCAMGYVIAYLLLGLTFFHGLMNGLAASPASYAKAVLSVLLVVCVLYAAGTVLFSFASRLIAETKS